MSPTPFRMTASIRSLRCAVATLAVLLPSVASAQSLTTTFASNNSFAGNMFNVAVLGGPLRFTGMDVNIGSEFASGLAGVISLWTRAGGYEGAENDEGAWTARGSYNVVAAGVDNPTFVDFTDFQLGGGSLTGFYVSLTSYNGGAASEGLSMHYTNGTASYANGDLRIDAGIGRGDPDFSGLTFSPRVWNGTLYYDRAVASVPEPSALLLVGAGMFVLGAARRRRSQL